MTKTRLLMVDILCVEADNIASYVLERQIERLGYRMVGKAEDTQSALEKMVELKPDLVLMEIRLGGETDGIEAAGHITNKHKIPVVFVTTLQDSSIRQRALQLHSVDYLQKPIQLRTLRQVVEKFFPEVKKKRVLLVEDDYIISMLLEKQIERMGYEVASKVESGELAIEKVQEERPDLILMDIHLKGELNGIETVKIIREFSDIPVLYLTGNASEITRKEAEDTHPDGFMIKPVDMEFLRQSIRNILEKQPA